ncbi:MAG TPA: DUF2169 domain-containing protein, partial [Myxococcales bacterium]|nr:DUF2169 domain-containing protein [Myxococcales bacterium]
TLQVGKHKRSLQIFGPRTVKWVAPKKKGTGKSKRMEPQPPVISKPGAIKEVELSYENAYGGFATFFPDNPEAYRKAVDDAQEQAKAKKEAQEKTAEEAKKQAEEKQRVQAAEEKAVQAKASMEAHFESGTKDISSAPDEDLAVELGSARKKTADGTVVLDVAELAEAQARESKALEAHLKKEAESAANAPEKQTDGAIKIDSNALAELAAAATEEAEKRAQSKSRDVRGTQVLELEKRGDHVLAEASWIEEQKMERRRLYEKWGVAPQKNVAWEEGDFPRLPCPSNPVGKGFALGHSKASIDGLEMPLIEDAANLLKPTDLARDPATLHLPQQASAGFGFYCKSWFPRADFCGVNSNEVEKFQLEMDKELVENLDPDKKEDQAAIEALMDRKAKELDIRFHNGAHPTLQVSDLEGSEEVYLTNLDADGKTFFKLPGDTPLVRFDRGQGWEPVEVGLDTIVIDRENTQLFMVWRGFLNYGGPDELGEYPRAELDVLDFSLGTNSNEHDAEEANRILNQTQALQLGVDEISDEENAAFENQVIQAGIGMGGVQEKARVHGQKRADGAVQDGIDQQIVVNDDAWIEQAKQRGMSDDEIAKLKQEKSVKDDILAKKEAMRQRLIAIKAQEEAEKKKKKKAKTSAPKASKKSKE